MGSSVFQLVTKILLVCSLLWNGTSFAVIPDVGSNLVATQPYYLFGTVATTFINTNTTAFENKSGNLWLNQLIVNGTYNFSDNLSMVGAIDVSNQIANNYDLSVDYASLNYGTNIGPVDTTIRVGRLKYDYGLFESERNNPSSRTTVFLPFSTYWPTFDKYEQSVDGIQADLQTHVGNEGNISFSSTYGKGVIPEDNQAGIFYGYFHTPLDGTLSIIKPVISNTLKYQSIHWQVQYNETTFQDRREYDGVTPTDLPVSFDFVHKFKTLGIRYSGEKFCSSAEIVKHDFPTDPVGFFVEECMTINPDLRLTVGYSKFFHENTNVPPIVPTPDWYRNGQEYTLGLTYRVSSNVTIKGEFDTGKGIGWFPYPANSPNWNIFGVQLVYKFDLLK